MHFKTAAVTKVLLILAICLSIDTFSQSHVVKVNHFEKVIISPHIQVTFVAGESEKVTIASNKVSDDKLNIEVKGQTLRIYLKDAKTFTETKKVESDSWKGKRPIYQGTIVKATVTYTSINELSLLGEEDFVFESPFEQDKLKLKIYGESNVHFGALEVKEFSAKIYGESFLTVKEGGIDEQKITCYGECEINMPDILNKNSKITAYGEGLFNVNVSDNLKVTAYGEAEVNYLGNPVVTKGVILGEARIKKAN